MADTISFPAIALFLTAIGMTITLVSSIAVVVWRFSALSAKMEVLASKMAEIASDLKNGRAQSEVIANRMTIVELRVETFMRQMDSLISRVERAEDRQSD
jgi:hypothetical protein